MTLTCETRDRFPPDRVTEFLQQARASSAVLAAFAVVVSVLLVVTPPSAAQLAAADPLVQWVASLAGVHAIPMVSLAAPVVWWLFVPGAPSAWKRAVAHALLACVLVAVGFSLLRLAVGPVFPSFIPPEESARPGMALGICAALLEEGVFRLALLTPLYVVMVRSGGNRVLAGLLAVVLTALVLAIVHEVGPGATASHSEFLMVRFLILGCLMGALFLWPGPVFLVTGHCAAHVAIPLLFAGAAS